MFNFQIAETDYDNSTNHGMGNPWTYVLTNLESSTQYNLSVMAENERGYRSSFASSFAVFTTNGNTFRPVIYSLIIT